MIRFFPLALIVSMIIGGCSLENVPPTPLKVTSPGREPLVVDSYITAHILSNMILPIYVEAQDPDGDMAGLWFVVTQVGVKSSSHYIPLSPENRKDFKGFVTIDIPKLETNERLRVEIIVVDQKGLKSSPVIKETTIGFAFPETIPEKWKSPDVRKLGHIFFDFIKHKEMDRF
ncbi:MAG: hypothetical protein N2260_03100 [Syntrophobacterales bacterium]|nr:hypothetical protein [Syntrophobacterales bacterium]